MARIGGRVHLRRDAVRAALGAVLGGVGRAPGAPWGNAGLWALALVAALFATRELFGVPIPQPNLHRQIPDWWRTFFSPPVASLFYGLGLGIGFLTYISFGTLVAVAAAAAVSGNALAGGPLLGAFGLTRGLSVLVSWPGTTEERLARVIDRLDALAASRVPALTNGFLLVGVTVTAAVAAIGGTSTSGSGLASIAVATVFSWASLDKILRPSAWWSSLEQYALGPTHRPVAIAVPALEFGVPMFVVAGQRTMAAILALVLLAGFSIALLRARRLRGNRVTCGCFGRTRARDYRILLARNVGIALIALATLAAPSRRAGSIHVPQGVELVPMVLALGGLILVAGVGREVLRMLRSDRRDTPVAS
jgi:methylamine utilization protein MauE